MVCLIDLDAVGAMNVDIIWSSIRDVLPEAVLVSEDESIAVVRLEGGRLEYREA